MSKYLIIFLLIISLFTPKASQAASLKGRILLNVERSGEAWYVSPADSKRYFLGRPGDAYAVMRKLGLGISEADFQKIAQAGTAVKGEAGITSRLAGRILLRVERSGEAWYVNPVDGKKYYLGRPDDAFKVMRQLGLGCRSRDLALIPNATPRPVLDGYSSFVSGQKITTDRGSFAYDKLDIDLSNPKLQVITATADQVDCKADCHAQPLISYVSAHNAFAAINGSYFCTSASCVLNYYYFPVYDSASGILVNENQLKYWTTGPLFAFGSDNKAYFFSDSRKFKSIADFEASYGTKLQALIGNNPCLIDKGESCLLELSMDTKQALGKYARSALMLKGDILSTVLVKSATMEDLVSVLKALGAQSALNIDGGYSTAVYYGDSYVAGPGRDIPNALLFAEK